MTPSRRDFLRTSLAAGGAMAVGGSLGSPRPLLGAHPRDASSTAGTSEEHQTPAHGSASGSLRILILGGTSFLGPHQVHRALERGHEVSIFTRGRTEPEIFVEAFRHVEHLVGDREGDLATLEGRSWDVVLDNSTRKWEWARDSARLLADAADLYLFVSSTGVYWPYLTTDIDETTALRTEDPSAGENASASYAVMKTLGEQEVQKAFGERAIIARPQHFTGPGERQNRHPFWVERMERGGEILAMGKKTDPVMLLDVRDLVDFMLHLVETRTTGVFNVAGPASPLTMAEFLHGLRFCTGAPVRWTWIEDYDFLQGQELTAVVPWIMPVGTEKGYTSINIEKALAHGLTHRSLAETHLDTRDWWYSDAVPPERREGARFALTPEREREILEAWKRRPGR